jgi:hypothetical protein
VQGAERIAGRQGPLGLLRPLAGLVEGSEDEGVQAGVAHLDTGDHGVDEFDGGEVPTPDAGGQLGGRGVSQIVGHRRPPFVLHGTQESQSAQEQCPQQHKGNQPVTRAEVFPSAPLEDPRSCLPSQDRPPPVQASMDPHDCRVVGFMSSARGATRCMRTRLPGRGQAGPARPRPGHIRASGQLAGNRGPSHALT